MPMPRFTKKPSFSSLAARAAIWSRVQAIVGLLRLANGALLDLLVVWRAAEQPLYVDGWRVDVVGVELADLDQFLDLGDADLGGARHHRIEVARRLAEDEVAG